MKIWIQSIMICIIRQNTLMMMSFTKLDRKISNRNRKFIKIFITIRKQSTSIRGEYASKRGITINSQRLI